MLEPGPTHWVLTLTSIVSRRVDEKHRCLSGHRVVRRRVERIVTAQKLVVAGPHFELTAALERTAPAEDVAPGVVVCDDRQTRQHVLFVVENDSDVIVRIEIVKGGGGSHSLCLRINSLRDHCSAHM